MNWEIIGYIGSGFVLLSFLWEGWKLRALNSIGALLWLSYGMAMDSGSIIFLNGSILLIHITKLSIKRREKNSSTEELKKRLEKNLKKRPTKKNFKKSTRP